MFGSFDHVYVLNWPTLDLMDERTEAAYDDLCKTVQIARAVGITPSQRDEILADADLLTAEGIRDYEAALRREIYKRQGMPVTKSKPKLEPAPIALPAIIGFDRIANL